MTVQELIAALQTKTPTHRVVVMVNPPHDVRPIVDVATMIDEATLGPVYLRAGAPETDPL